MSKFYCNNCEEDVELKNGKCPKCNANWSKEIEECLESEGLNYFLKSNLSELENNNQKIEKDLEKERPSETITKEDIKKTIDFYLNWVFWIKLTTYITGIILLILSLVLIGESDGISLLMLIPAVTMLGYASIMENNLKWKAYMLHTNANLPYKK